MTSSSSSLMEETTKKVPLSSEIKRTRPALQYQSGFGNHFSTEAIPNALPEGQNTPQTCPYGTFRKPCSFHAHHIFPLAPRLSPRHAQGFLLCQDFGMFVSSLSLGLMLSPSRTFAHRSLRRAIIWHGIHRPPRA